VIHAAPLLASESTSGWALTWIAVGLLAFALVSKRLHGTVITPAIFFVTLGLVLGTEGINLIGDSISPEGVRLLAEVTLALVLFSDASSIHIRALRREAGLPIRLLTIGLPLTIVAGLVAGLPLFPSLTVAEVAALAILLAPTDAALGETVVTDTRLPLMLRQGLNVEAGLNDGICVPLLMTALALAEIEEASSFTGHVLADLLKQVAIATATGVVAGAVAALGLRWARAHDVIDHSWVQVVPLAAAAMSYTATVELGGSGFVAAFVGGLAYRFAGGAEVTAPSTRLMGELGDLLSAVTFFVFGAVIVGAAVTDLDMATLIYAVLGLTVLRMVPVAIALMGTGERMPTVLFAGWFGPRGLASIVFALIVVEDTSLPGTARIVQVAVVTVLISVFAHGLTAPVLTQRYVAWREQQESATPDDAEDAATP